jgi:hypothetical protein
VRGNDVAAHRAAGEQEVVLTDFASGKPENISVPVFLHFYSFTQKTKFNYSMLRNRECIYRISDPDFYPSSIPDPVIAPFL